MKNFKRGNMLISVLLTLVFCVGAFFTCFTILRNCQHESAQAENALGGTHVFAYDDNYVDWQGYKGAGYIWWDWDIYKNNSTFEIWDEAGLYYFSRSVSKGGCTFEGKTVKLMADLDMREYTYKDNGNTEAEYTVNWFPGIGMDVWPNMIGFVLYYGNSTPFSGVFDGGGHTVANTYILVQGEGHTRMFPQLGFFSWVQNAVIKNLRLFNITLDTYDTGAYESRMGGLIATGTGTVTIEQCMLENINLLNPGSQNVYGAGLICSSDGNLFANNIIIKDISMKESTNYKYFAILGPALYQNLSFNYSNSLINCDADLKGYAWIRDSAYIEPFSSDKVLKLTNTEEDQENTIYAFYSDSSEDEKKEIAEKLKAYNYDWYIPLENYQDLIQEDNLEDDGEEETNNFPEDNKNALIQIGLPCLKIFMEFNEYSYLSKDQNCGTIDCSSEKGNDSVLSDNKFLIPTFIEKETIKNIVLKSKSVDLKIYDILLTAKPIDGYKFVTWNMRDNSIEAHFSTEEYFFKFSQINGVTPKIELMVGGWQDYDKSEITVYYDLVVKATVEDEKNSTCLIYTISSGTDLWRITYEFGKILAVSDGGMNEYVTNDVSDGTGKYLVYGKIKDLTKGETYTINPITKTKTYDVEVA